MIAPGAGDRCDCRADGETPVDGSEATREGLGCSGGPVDGLPDGSLGLADAVMAVLRRWGMDVPPMVLAEMCERWPCLASMDIEGDVLPRLSQLDFLMEAGAMSAAETSRLLISQPRCLSSYTVQPIWERDGLVAVNKPFDMRIDVPKREARRWPEERTVADWFLGVHPGAKVRFCNQLDHATSGVLLMAATKAAGRLGSGMFEHRQARKTYHALVLGWPPWPVGEQHRCLDRLADGEGFARRVAAPDEAGAEDAETHVTVLARGTWPGATLPGEHSQRLLQALGQAPRAPIQAALVEARPITGRRHQIRLHLAAAGFPILGDDAYGGHPWGDRSGSYRMFLHAHRLELPLADEAAVIVAPCEFASELSFSCSELPA